MFWAILSPMRAISITLLLASPAVAWDTSLQGEACVLGHDFGTARLEVTHDAHRSQPYVIEITRTDAPWVPADEFSIQFEGPNTLTISTDRHEMGPNNSAVSVADTGFGNVLDGLEFNHFAFAILGDQMLAMPLVGAAPKVVKFRNCTARVDT